MIELRNKRYEMVQKYQYGAPGIEIDPSKAVKLYTSAAKQQGYAPAQYELARCYRYGLGVEVDEKKAVEFYTLAAKQGDTEALYTLGQCYECGVVGGKKSYGALHLSGRARRCRSAI